MHRLPRLSTILKTWLVASLSLIAQPQISLAQAYPSKAVKIIVQTAAGSSIDVAARLLAEHLTRRWGQQAFVVNQPGAGGAIATRALTTAPNDGYTLFFAASSVFLVLPEIQKNSAADVNSLVPVAFVGETPMAVAVSAKAPVNSLSELFALTKKTAGGLNCAVSTRGGLSHLSAEALREASKSDMTFINYPGTAQALTDVISDRVPVIVDSISAILGPASGGQLKVLAVAGPSRLKSIPNVPTVSETLPGFEATAWFALVVPAGTVPEIAGQIGNDVGAILQDPALIARLEEIGTFTRNIKPDALKGYIDAQKDRWNPIVRNFGG